MIQIYLCLLNLYACPYTLEGIFALGVLDART